MNVLIAGLGHLRNDPRSQNVLNSIADSGNLSGALEIQTSTPSLSSLILRRATSFVTEVSENQISIHRTWSSRSASRRYWLEQIQRSQNLSKAVQKLANKTESTASDEFWINQFALAYRGLSSYVVHLNGAVPIFIVAEDLMTAHGAVLLKPHTGWKVIYDAHELFVESLKLSGEEHSFDSLDFFHQIEAVTWNLCDELVTVSPGIARFIRDSVPRTSVFVIPNFCPISMKSREEYNRTDAALRCVYVGGVGPLRQVDVLVRNWPLVATSPQLHLYLMPSRFADEVVVGSQRNPNIHIHAPVRPEELVRTMAEYDIGILPYCYPYPYSQASPNKFGECLAAGLAVICEQDTWISELVRANHVGVSVPFENQHLLHNLLMSVTSERLKIWRRNSARAFDTQFNWNLYVTTLFKQIDVLLNEHDKACWSRHNQISVKRRFADIPISILEMTIDRNRSLLVKLYHKVKKRRLIALIPHWLIRDNA